MSQPTAAGDAAPATMRAVVVTRPGGLDALEIKGVPVPVRKPRLPRQLRRGGQLLRPGPQGTVVGREPAKMWIAGLSTLDRPLLHLHTQYNLSLPWSSIDMDFMNLNQAAHGDREFGHIESRVGVDRKIVAGHATDLRVVRRIAAWARAAAGRHASRTLRLARFGDNMRDVAVTEGDKVEAQLRFGFSVNTYAVNDLVAVVDQVEDKATAELAAEYVESYDVVPALRPGGIRHDSLLYAARLELGLRTFLTEGGFGGEGDWKTSALLRAMKVMGLGQAGGTSFMEDYTYHLGPGTPCALGAHTLEVCPVDLETLTDYAATWGVSRRGSSIGRRTPGTPAYGFRLVPRQGRRSLRKVATRCVRPDLAAAQLDSRTTRRQGTVRMPGSGLPPMASSSRSAACRPISARSVSIVVRGGRHAKAMTSQLS
ncbi:hypothetical protein [Streptomyces sp. NPDC050121]|uniref:L-arabinose isomerase family protein n=1 Tax=Streptomyces sp. NPDC050121 TaxID=3365601 RepID=UPI00379289F7